jgi:hypothetical protein
MGESQHILFPLKFNRSPSIKAREERLEAPHRGPNEVPCEHAHNVGGLDTRYLF